MLNMRLRSLFETVFFALGTAFTCFVILMSSTLQARTIHFTEKLTSSTAAKSDIEAQLSNADQGTDQDVGVHRGLIYIETMMPKPHSAPQDFCFEDPQLRSCNAPADAPFESAPPEFLPASLERATLNLV